MEIQVHHHYHVDAQSTEFERTHNLPGRPPTYTPDRPELPGDCMRESVMTRDLGGALFAAVADCPPLVNKHSKPEYIAH